MNSPIVADCCPKKNLRGSLESYRKLYILYRLWLKPLMVSLISHYQFWLKILMRPGAPWDLAKVWLGWARVGP